MNRDTLPAAIKDLDESFPDGSVSGVHSLAGGMYTYKLRKLMDGTDVNVEVYASPSRHTIAERASRARSPLAPLPLDPNTSLAPPLPESGRYLIRESSLSRVPMRLRAGTVREGGCLHSSGAGLRICWSAPLWNAHTCGCFRASRRCAAESSLQTVSSPKSRARAPPQVFPILSPPHALFFIPRQLRQREGEPHLRDESSVYGQSRSVRTCSF